MYGVVSLPRNAATTLSANRPACLTACCALGAHVAPGSSFERSGTAAVSPALHASATPLTRRSGVHTIRPDRSTGRPDREARGLAFTPAVQTTVPASNSSP